MKENKNELKKGRLSLDERKYIIDNIKELGAEAVASKLKRLVETVSEFATSQGISFDDTVPEDKVLQAVASKEFKDSPEWEALKEELLDHELNYFTHRYSKLKVQFNEGIVASEEAQIFQLIKFEILMQRNLRASKKGMYEVRRMEKLLAKEYAKWDGKDMDNEARAFVLNLENQILSARAGNSAKSQEFIKLQEKYSAIMKELKATRDQRISKIENIKETFVELIKSLQDEEIRRREDKQMQLAKMAMDKEYKRLGDYHTYMDGGIDQPILNAETLKD